MQVKINQRVFRYVKFTLVLLAFFFLVNKTIQKIFFDDYLTFLILNFQNIDFLFLIAVLMLLCIVNWGLEAFKWYFIRNKVDSYFDSYASVLCGLGLSMFMPNRGGEFIGRVLYISDTKKIKNAVLSIFTSYSQQLLTVIFGVISLFLVNHHLKLTNELLYLSSVLGAIFFIVYFLLPLILKWKLWTKFSINDSQFNYYQLIVLVFFSTIRYFIFTLPYFLLFTFFDVYNESNFIEIWFLINIQFLATSYIPSYVLLDAGIRGGISIYLFGLIGVSAEIAFSTTLIIWLINVFIPALSGIIISLKLRSPQVIE